jgi:hypothetical protein
VKSIAAHLKSGDYRALILERDPTLDARVEASFQSREELASEGVKGMEMWKKVLERACAQAQLVKPREIGPEGHEIAVFKLDRGHFELRKIKHRWMLTVTSLMLPAVDGAKETPAEAIQSMIEHLEADEFDRVAERFADKFPAEKEGRAAQLRRLSGSARQQKPQVIAKLKQALLNDPTIRPPDGEKPGDDARGTWRADYPMDGLHLLLKDGMWMFQQ